MTAVVVLTLALIGSCMPTWPSNNQEEAELIRATERERVRALVRADTVTARRLHADEFQLINPLGEAYSKEQYLGGIASGQFDYLAWEPEVIDVRLYGNAAVIRYQSELEIVVDGKSVPRRRHWHTDCYEKRDGQWQIVWSQATSVR
ncbi:MAG: nuclear transport factor 2 family protein [Gemmatimonadales bacterium]